MADQRGPLRPIDPPFVALGPSGVAIRTRLKGLTADDDKVLRAMGAHLGSPASKISSAGVLMGWSTPRRRGRPVSGS
jgi:hypothetical protein